MTFDMESVKEKEGGRVVKLTLFGITAPDSQITFQLKELLFSRLIEISARSVSTNLRSSALTSNTLSFLKTASPSKHVHSVIKLPSYVHDHYLFCLIARQLLLQSPLLAAVKLPSTQKVYSYSEYIHPAFLGYKVARPASNGDRKMSVDDGDDYDENEDEGNDDISSSMSQLGGPMLKLVRNTHVSSYDDSKKPHPIFAEISKEENGPAKYTFTHGVSAIWQQNEFSFIYNTLPIGPVQGGRQPTSTQATKVPSASQGLALVQLSLAYSGSSPSKSYQYMTSSESPTLVTTGGFLQVCDDVRVLNDQLLSPTSTEDISLNADQAGRQNIGMGRASLGNSIDTSVSIPLTNDNSSSNSSQGLQVLDGELELHLHILPTLPMQIQYLHDAINNCLEQALVWYVFERVLATSNNDTQLGNNSWMETSIDLFQRAFHRIRKPVVSIPSSLIPIFSNTAFASTTTSTTSHLWDKFTISCILSKENIHELLENLRTSFEEISPTLASTAALFKRTGKGTSTHEVDSDDLVDCIVASRFHSDDTSNSSISSSSQNTIDGKGIQTQSTTTSFTVVPDYDSSTTGSLPLPRNVKCRHYFLVGSMEGTVFSMYSFNINTSTLVKIKESTQEIIQRLIQRGRAYAVTSITNLTTNLRKTVRSTTISAITSQPTVIDTISVITNKLMPLFVFGDFVLGQLSYQHRKLSNIMKMKESKMTEINPEILNWFDRLPASVWRRGESLVSTTMQSPCTKLSDTSSGVLEQQFRRLIDEIYHMFIKEERCEVLKIISNDEPTTAFLLFPQPKRSSILLLDIHHYNTGMLVITPRCIDIAELLIASIVSYPHPEFAFSDTIESAYLQWVQQSIQRDSHFSVYDILKVSYKSIEKSLLLKQRLDRINSIFVPHCFLWYGNSFVPPPSLSLVPNVFNIREIQNKLQSWSEIATNTSTYYTDIYHNLDNSSIIQYKKFGRLLNISDLNLKEIFVPLKSEIPVSTDVNDVSKVSSLFIVPFHVYPHHQLALIDPSIIGYALVEVTEITVQQSETTDLNTQKDLNSDVSIIKVDSSSISVSISLFAMNASCCMMKKEKSIDHRLTDSKPPTIVAMSLEPTIDRVKENKKEVEVEITEILDEAKISPEIEGLSPTILYYSSSSPVIIDDTEEYYDAMNVPQVICNNIFRLVLAWRRSTA